jgi:hypothetical protein
MAANERVRLAAHGMRARLAWWPAAVAAAKAVGDRLVDHGLGAFGVLAAVASLGGCWALLLALPVVGALAARAAQARRAVLGVEPLAVHTEPCGHRSPLPVGRLKERGIAGIDAPADEALGDAVVGGARPQRDHSPDDRGVERLGLGQALGEDLALTGALWWWLAPPEPHRGGLALDWWQRQAQRGMVHAGLGWS